MWRRVDLSVIMINHNTKKLTEQAVQSILNSAPMLSYEIIVVDNSDKKDEFFYSSLQQVTVLSNIENKGFAMAVILVLRWQKAGICYF